MRNPLFSVMAGLGLLAAPLAAEEEAPAARASWRSLVPGIELGVFAAPGRTSAWW